MHVSFWSNKTHNRMFILTTVLAFMKCDFGPFWYTQLVYFGSLIGWTTCSNRKALKSSNGLLFTTICIQVLQDCFLTEYSEISKDWWLSHNKLSLLCQSELMVQSVKVSAQGMMSCKTPRCQVSFLYPRYFYQYRWHYIVYFCSLVLF